MIILIVVTLNLQMCLVRIDIFIMVQHLNYKYHMSLYLILSTELSPFMLFYLNVLFVIRLYMIVIVSFTDIFLMKHFFILLFVQLKITKYFLLFLLEVS